MKRTRVENRALVILLSSKIVKTTIGELEENSAVRSFRTTAADRKPYQTKYYNLDMIISLGYRIRSVVATHFRKWSTQHKESQST